MNSPTQIVPYDARGWEGVHVPKFRDAERCWKFMRKHGFRRLPERTEDVFLKNIRMAVDYAERIHSRLPIKFEVLIMNDPELSLDYLFKVIHAPLEEFEPALSKSASVLVRYAKTVLEGPLPEHLEHHLIGDPHSCFEYAWQILDGRLPEALHNFMFGANMDSRIAAKYRGYVSKLNDAEEYNPSNSSPSEYFEFIKWQRKNLHRLIIHYGKAYGVDSSKSVGEFLYELEHGR